MLSGFAPHACNRKARPIPNDGVRKTRIVRGVHSSHRCFVTSGLRRVGRAAIVGATLVLVACGRSSLFVGSGAGGNASSTSGSGTSVGTTSTVSATSVGTTGGPTCNKNDLTTWRTERYRNNGDYQRAAVAVSGVPWVALKPTNGNMILAELGLDPAQGIVFLQQIEVPSSPVYPVALDVDEKRAVVLTSSGINFNGDIELWRIDRVDGSVVHAPVGSPPQDPAFTVGAAIGLVGDHVAVAYSRYAENQGTIELRDADLQILQTMPMDPSSFIAVRNDASTVDLYDGAAKRVRASASSLTLEPVDPDWQTIGGLGNVLVQFDTGVRMTNGMTSWLGPFPHTQFSPPAVVRTHGTQAVFSLETELTAVVGHVNGSALDWLRIDTAPEAPGLGLGLMPVVEDGRLGLFYLGLEIPSPIQPLRYYGLACP
jgi:hypothetical protein